MVWQYLKKGRQPGRAAESGTERTSQDAADGSAFRPRAGKFVVEKSPGGKDHFILVAGNGQVIVTSADYERREAALNGIEPVKKNAPTQR